MIPIYPNTSLERGLTLVAMRQQVLEMPPGVLEMQFMALYECCLNQGDALTVADAQLQQSAQQIHDMHQSLFFLQGYATGAQSAPPAPSTPSKPHQPSR